MPFHTSDNVDHPLNFYGATKIANELMAHAYAQLFAIPATGLRFFTVYGPWGRCCYRNKASQPSSAQLSASNSSISTRNSSHCEYSRSLLSFQLEMDAPVVHADIDVVILRVD